MKDTNIILKAILYVLCFVAVMLIVIYCRLLGI